MKKICLMMAMMLIAMCSGVGAWAGVTLKLEFTSGNNYIKKVVVTEGSQTRTFDFSKNVNNLGTFQGASSTPTEIASTEDASYKAVINAQAGKYQTHSDQYGAQINAGTFMTFEVEGDATVTTTVSYNGTGSLALSVDGVSYGTVSYTAVGDYELNYVAPAGPTEVWDFGQAVVEGATNHITADVINAWYKQEDGSYKSADGKKTYADAEALAANIANASGFTLPSFTVGDLSYSNNGAVNHRLRTKKTNVMYYDASAYGDYLGYVYSNSNAVGSKVNMTLANCKVGDKIEYVLGKNGTKSTVEFANATTNDVLGSCLVSSNGQVATFYVPADGKYMVYSVEDKLCVARITRVPAATATISGTLKLDELTGSELASKLEGQTLKFTCDKMVGFSKEATLNADGTYTVEVPAGYEYKAHFSNTTYVFASGETVAVGDNDRKVTDKDIVMSAIESVSVDGTITCPSSLDLSKVTIVFTSSKLFVPSLKLGKDNAYSVVLEKGVEYGLSIEGANDYECSTTKMQYSADATGVEIVIAARPVYNITINPTVATAAELSTATFKFTNKSDSYVYTFTGTEGISLRDGEYTVEVSNSGAYSQLLTSRLKVNGAAVSKTLDFVSGVSSWTFDSNFTNENGSAEINYMGLLTTGLKTHGGGARASLANGGTIKVPVSGSCKIKITADYEYALYVGETAICNAKTGSTSQIDEFTYEYTGEAGYVTITSKDKTSYVNGVSISKEVAYAATLYVGSTREYKTVTDALSVINNMTRPAGEAGRVTVMIDPGNYDEMPVVNADYVTFKNSASEPSIALKNKGVDIDENAVRITSYYGEGYNYYSCGSDNKWNERVLAVSKENGINTYVCHGGSTNEGYWNATVVVKGKNFIAEDIIFENSFNQYISAKEANDVVINKVGSNSKATKVSEGVVRPTTAGSVEVQDKKYVERAAAIAIIGDRAVLNHCAVIGRQDSFYGHTSVRVACYKCELYGATDYIFGSQDMIVYDSKLVMNTSDDKNDQAYLIALKAPAYKGSLFMNCDIVSTVPGVNTASTYKSKPGFLGRPWDKVEYAVFANVNVETTNYAANSLNYAGKSLLVKNPWNSTLAGVSAYSFEYNIDCQGADRIDGGYEGKTLTDSEAEEVTLYAFTKGNDEWNPFAELFGVDSEKSAYAIATPIEEVIVDGLAGEKEVVSVEYYSINGQKVSEDFQGMAIKVIRYADGSKDAIKMMKK